jgi:hypothetical protein
VLVERFQNLKQTDRVLCAETIFWAILATVETNEVFAEVPCCEALEGGDENAAASFGYLHVVLETGCREYAKRVLRRAPDEPFKIRVDVGHLEILRGFRRPNGWRA